MIEIDPESTNPREYVKVQPCVVHLLTPKWHNWFSYLLL